MTINRVPAVIVVVGSGAAGLSAALAAAEAAAADPESSIRIVMIERAPEGEHGGNTRWSPAYMRMSSPERTDPDLAAYVQTVSGGGELLAATCPRLTPHTSRSLT